MYGLVNARGNRSQNAARREKQLKDWAGVSEERKNELSQYCKSVLAGDFKLDAYARPVLEKLAKN